MDVHALHCRARGDELSTSWPSSTAGGPSSAFLCKVRVRRLVDDYCRPLGNISTALFLAGVVFGVIAALAGQIDLLAPWMILAYVAFVGAILVGVLITDPWVERLARAADASPVEEASDSLRAVIGDPVARGATWALMGTIAAMVFIMVVKPLG